ncbi:hypothetical protein MTY66_46710 [Mycolicibacterium sp. TY66]|uniref:hypothetical protein n=1 Tax=unclassified Mycolicibacterium TaxID=2636767 RepID=UPI001BB3514F|nr:MULTISPECIES: hypothetical protein [unclassified Mycolicibacterium]BCI83046.1 hypothetical protein MTY66_46710 [Mycolicibacterium sp. TY66]BCJ79306.1 hypothetical protein MTY81_06790 [Mycolicibacterium sp. TY81]
MRLEQATHILESNRAKMRMSIFTEEIPGQIAAGINRLGDGEDTYYSIYPVGPEVPYDEFPYSHERIQATGVAPDRLTVEIKQRDANGVHRLYTIGRLGDAGEWAETEPIQNGDNTYLVRPSEVLTATDAIALFQHYYDTHTVPEGWSLREQSEFSDTAVAEQYGEGERCPPETRAP